MSNIKKNLPFFLLLLFIGLSSCDETGNKLEDIAKEFNNAQKEKWEKVYDYNKMNLHPFTGPIDYFTAKSYITNNSNPILFPQTRLSTIYTNDTIKNTKSLWIDKKAILAFANSLIRADSLNGIRIYFAQYDDNASNYDTNLSKKLNGMRTLIFVATKTKDTSNSFHPKGKYTDGLYVYDYNSLCPDSCRNADF